jgi:hypothetical protein
MNTTRTYYQRSFEDILYDAVYLLYSAHDFIPGNLKDDLSRTFSRASIVNSILLLECGANCLIESLKLPSKLFNDIDKIAFISKFEFFLIQHNIKETFDRGCSEVQAISDLKSIRDALVHPKVKKQDMVKISENCWSADFGESQHLSLPRDQHSWEKEHAIVALKAVNQFYNKYLLEWCGFSQKLIVDLLLSSEPVDIDNPVGASIDGVRGLDRAVTDWGIDFKFIGKKL